MAFVVKDRVKETTTTTGTGTYTLAGAVDGFQSFAAIGNTNSTSYCVTDGIDWEINKGVYTSSGTTLSRAAVLASTNGGAEVSWGAGTKTAFCVDPATSSFWNLAAGLVKGDGAGGLTRVVITTAGENLLDDATTSDQLTTLGVSTFAKTILDDADAATVRSTLVLGTAAVADTGTVDGDVPVFASGAIDMADKVLQRPALKDIAEKVQTINHSSSGALAIDVSAGNVVILNQSANITSTTFSNWPTSGDFGGCTIIRVKDASGTTRSWTHATAVDWPGGTAPDLTQTTGAVDILVFMTVDAGTRIHGAMSSADSK